MGKGYIIVQLSKEQEALPITSAKIKIRDQKTKEVIFETDSGVDESGRSEIIELDAPDKNLSLEPTNKTYIPYARYDVLVNAEGYNNVLIEGVSIFDETTSIQNVSLTEIIKIGAAAFYNTTEDRIVIPPHQLLLDVQRDQKTGVLSQPFVLREVYIPEYITVHLGAPSTWAQNVTVRFVDYIKNVASHEVYPTWPEESLRANIYAQITFALNRVYTEWYVSRGYSFQITNSTAYDQAFVYGRNIFDNISRIVDEIFATYVKRSGAKQPLLTQYCDGRNVQCPGWLTQWGSKDLGAQGWIPYDILRNFYGSDIVLERATKVSGSPRSYPGFTLKQGSSGEPVRTTQTFLNRIAQNYPLIPKVAIDGKYGSTTTNQVKVFQQVFGLPQTGEVDYATWYKISAIYTGVTKIAELRSVHEEEVEYSYFVPHWPYKDAPDLPRIKYPKN